MKKLIALALVGAFACVGYAGDEKKSAETCKMECCKKSGKSCKDCSDCKDKMKDKEKSKDKKA